MTLVSLEKRLVKIEGELNPPRLQYVFVPPGGPCVAQRDEIRSLVASGVDVRLVRDPYAGPVGSP